MTCKHEIWEKDTAVDADGFCPLCMAVKLAKYRKALEEIASDDYQFPAEIAVLALKD